MSRKIVCTQSIVHTMPNTFEISSPATRRSHRTYTPEFKAQLVAACQQPDVSIAALAGQHGMNANVLHRWIKEHQRSGCHQLVQAATHATAAVASQGSAFIPLVLPTVSREQEVKIELRKGALSMVITWPLSAAADLTSWTAAIVK